MNKTVEKEIRDYVEVSDRITFLARNAVDDILYGPVCRDEDYEGFESAIGELREWATTEVPCELWVDVDCGSVFTSEPESYEEDGEVFEPFWESIYHLERKDILRALFGSKLVEFLVY